jgi:hypothetical protein
VKISDLEPNKWYQGNLEAINRELTIGGDWRRGREGPGGCCCWSLPGHGEPRLDAARGRESQRPDDMARMLFLCPLTPGTSVLAWKGSRSVKVVGCAST